MRSRRTIYTGHERRAPAAHRSLSDHWRLTRSLINTWHNFGPKTPWSARCFTLCSLSHFPPRIQGSQDDGPSKFSGFDWKIVGRVDCHADKSRAPRPLKAGASAYAARHRTAQSGRISRPAWRAVARRVAGVRDKRRKAPPGSDPGWMARALTGRARAPVLRGRRSHASETTGGMIASKYSR